MTDFGLAKRLEADSNLTGSGQILGTPSYMPPEQAAANLDQIGPASDVYSLGAVLYCLLTGRPPFQAANPLETLMQVLEQEPVPPRQLNPGIPLDLDTIVPQVPGKESRAALSRRPRHLADELDRFLSGRPIHGAADRPRRTRLAVVQAKSGGGESVERGDTNVGGGPHRLHGGVFS